MSMTQSFEVARATGVCGSTGRPIAIGESYIACLWTAPLDGPTTDSQDRMQRTDYSTEAWASGARPSGAVVGHWRSTLAAPNARKRAFIGDDELLDLFMQLGDATEAKRLAFRYLLALILVRRRLLRIETTRKRGAMLVRLRPVGDAPGKLVEVADPGIDEAMVAEATEQLSAVLATDEPVAP